MPKEEKNKTEKKKILEVPENIIVKELAEKMEIKSTELIAKLIENKIFASINEVLDFETAEIIADDFGFELKKLESVDKKRKQSLKKNIGSGAKKRPPVVVVMGHVDHGKTTLLDKILKTNVVEKEAGGITQNFSAYQVKKKGEMITFMDTPGHEAFHAMRQRGAYATDLAVIVIAANDGVKPQTIEAINFAREMEVPILIAINKIDKPEANVEKVKKQLSELDIMPEDWGGKTVCVNISAKTGKGVDELLEMIVLTADMEEIKANPNSLAEAFVIESHLNPKSGPVATILIQNGTLKNSDFVSVESHWGRIKEIRDFSGKKINKATPSMPVVITGLNEVPKVGSLIFAETSRFAAESKVREFLQAEQTGSVENKAVDSARIKQLVKSHQMKKLNIILKADTKGSLEAIVQILETIKSDEAVIQILQMGVGNITETDIKMANSSGAKIIGFNIGLDTSIKKIARKEAVDIRIYKIIYELMNDIKEDLISILGMEIVRTDLGILKVIAIFKSAKKSAKKIEMIIGAKIESGKIEKASLIEIIRDGEKIGQGRVKELQYNKKIVEEVKSGNNAGITYEGNVIIKEGDAFKAYKEEEKERKI
ncbi:MAG: translation initiation factor IF-2 [Patescibacteria group bacterium]|nr:translation initiation factor IF-2 [Patescibacteria group bacterium]